MNGVICDPPNVAYTAQDVGDAGELGRYVTTWDSCSTQLAAKHAIA